MSYVQSTLVPGERILYRAHLHWATFLGGGLLFILFTIVATLFVAREDSQFAGFIVFILGVLPLAAAYIRYRTSEFAVTDKRVLIKTGLVRRHTLETLLNKVENISVEQGLLGRVLNYGTIQVTGTGSTKEMFPNIAAPLEFRKQVQGATLNYEAGKTGGFNPVSHPPDRAEKQCPFCAERILAQAKICRFCNRDITPALGK
jgi:membrane protein YdbS with pleckstrin-like domain